MGRGTKPFQSRTQPERVKLQRQVKQKRLDAEFIRAGIPDADFENSQMDKAEVKRLIKRAVDNGAEASDVKDQIDFETTFENNIRKNPIFSEDS